MANEGTDFAVDQLLRWLFVGLCIDFPLLQTLWPFYLDEPLVFEVFISRATPLGTGGTGNTNLVRVKILTVVLVDELGHFDVVIVEHLPQGISTLGACLLVGRVG